MNIRFLKIVHAKGKVQLSDSFLHKKGALEDIINILEHHRY